MSLQEFTAWAIKLADHLQKHIVSAVGVTAETSTSKTKDSN
jgi:hypothetical protein